MAEMSKKKVTKAELEKNRCSAIVHNVSLQTTIKDLEYLIKRKIGEPMPQIVFGESYGVNGGKRQKAYLNFKNKERVDQLMEIGSLTHHKEEMKISRYIPKNCPMSGHLTSTVSLTMDQTEEEENAFKKELTEYDLQKYFQTFGQIIACDWLSKYEVTLQFQSYDSVDQIILYDVSHTINGITIFAEKIPTKKQNENSTSDGRAYCIHVTNMPLDVTSDELSATFSVHVADILLQPGDQLSSYLTSKDVSSSEAWIKHWSNRQLGEDFIKKFSKRTIRGFELHCKVVQEPIGTTDLCRDFEKGTCRYPADQCNYKHIMCTEPDQCENSECWYGHTKKRAVTSYKRHVEDSEMNGYRVRIGNLPSTITKEQLLKQLNIPLKYIDRVKFPDESPVSNKVMVAYLVSQPSENLLRQKIRDWHNTSFSKDLTNKMKCQLEQNMNYFHFDNHPELPDTLHRSRTSSPASNSTATKLAPWCNSPKANKKKTINAKDQEPSDLDTLAPQWRWTGEKLSNDSVNTTEVYLLVDKTNKQRNAAIKIDRNKLDQTTQYEKIVLEKLKGLDGIPHMLTTNNDSWIIMEHIKGTTLQELIRTNSISFREKLMITIKLLDIVHEMHSRKVIHGHIIPDNISVTTPFDADQVNLLLTGFSQAYLLQDDTDARHRRQNTFYLAPQLERQSFTNNNHENQQGDPKIDTSSICAVLFWLITDSYPRESRNIREEAPHQLRNHAKTIDEEVMRATGVWTETEKHVPVKQHLQLTFDHGFGPADQQWSIDELAYQLQHMLRLVTKNNEENSCVSPPLTKKQIEASSMNTKTNSFLQLASFIDSMKRQFSIRYPDIHWSTDDKNQWFGHHQYVKNIDILTFQKQQRSIRIETFCSAEINRNEELLINIRAKLNQNNQVILPLGAWKGYEQEIIKEEIFKIFELELKILIDIFYKKMIM